MHPLRTFYFYSEKNEAEINEWIAFFQDIYERSVKKIRVVDNLGGDAQYNDVGQAFLKSTPTDMIYVRPGEYTVLSSIILSKQVSCTITGVGDPSLTKLRASSTAALTFKGERGTISNLTILVPESKEKEDINGRMEEMIKEIAISEKYGVVDLKLRKKVR